MEQADSPKRSESDSVSAKAARPDDRSAGDLVSAGLRLLGRVKNRASTVDADWFFGASALHDTDADGGDTNVSVPRDRSNETPNRIGRFVVHRRIGSGGYGVVLLATDPDLNREIALKLPAPEVLTQDELRARFLREGEAAASLNHPHIVTVLEAGQIGAIHYIASEFVSGGSLADWLTEHGADDIAIKPAARIVQTLALATQHAHSRGVLHRDIKPGNVLLNSDSDAAIQAEQLADCVQLADFGLARIDDPNRESHSTTSLEAVLGTPAYMSPEQAEGRNDEVDTRSDVWALGIVLYELLTGTNPFRRDTRLATLKAIWCDEVESPKQLNSDVPPDLEAICLKCLQKSQDDRYSTAAALADDLDRFLNGDTVSARVLTRWESAVRWYRHNRTVAALSVAVVGLVCIVAVVSSVLALQLGRSRGKILDALQREVLATGEANKQTNLAMKSLFEARLAQSRTERQSGAPGQALNSLEAANKAKDLAKRLNLGAEAKALLRNEVIAAYQLFDLKADKQWKIPAPEAETAVSPAANRFAEADVTTGKIAVRSMRDNKLIATLTQARSNISVSRLLFSPDGKYLACAWRRPNKMRRVQIWDIEKQKDLGLIVIPRINGRQFDFSSTSKWIAAANREEGIDIYSLPDLKRIKNIPTSDTVSLLQFSGDDKQLAVARTGAVDIVQVEAAKVARSIRFSRQLHAMDWSRDEKYIAITSDWNLHVLYAATGRLHRTFRHPSHVRLASFHPDGRFIASYCEDNYTRIFHIDDDRERIRVAENCLGFSSDGKWLRKPAGRWQVHLPRFWSVLRQPRVQDGISAAGLISFHSSGRLLCASNRTQMVVWDLERKVALDLNAQTNTSAVFASGAEFLVVSGPESASRRPLVTDASGEQRRLTLGEAEVLGPMGCGNLVVSRDGSVIACADSRFLKETRLINLKTGFSGKLNHYGSRWQSMTPDGRLLATATLRAKDVHVFDGANGKLLRAIPSGAARVAFSPDGTRLAILEPNHFSVYDTSNWSPIVARRRKAKGTVWPGGVCFSPDNKLLAIVSAHNEIVLLDTGNYEEIAQLNLVSGNLIETLAFSPQGDRLVAGVAGRWGSIHVWDLALLRRQLATLELDWDLQPLVVTPRPSVALEFDAK